jgi:lipopolysaccharide/colanic/teichoic acid biosynthesis glycosyltransferase
VDVRTRKDRAEFERLQQFCLEAVSCRGTITYLGSRTLAILLSCAEPAQVNELTARLRQNRAVDVQTHWLARRSPLPSRIVETLPRVDSIEAVPDTAATAKTAKRLRPPNTTARPHGVARRLSELGERGAAAVGLVVLAPLLLVLALTVKITSPGPVLAVHDRPGRDGRRCRVYRFRARLLPPRSPWDTPEVNGSTEDHWERMADSAGHTLHSSVGRFLTQTRLDGLPQLWNVLRGDLSLRSVASNSLARGAAVPKPKVAPNERFLS